MSHIRKRRRTAKNAKPADNKELERLIGALESMAVQPIDDDANRLFATEHAARTAALLAELRAWREQAAGEAAQGGRIIVEGYDETDRKRAFADAMNKAVRLFRSWRDIGITVLGMETLPRGGHRVTLEVDIIPFRRRLAAHPEDIEPAAKRAHAREFAAFRKHEDTHLKELVYDHFLETTGETPDVPDYVLINFTDADLMNEMIEKEFFRVGRNAEKDAPQPAPTQAVLKLAREGK